ncbi:tetratricopeptide repeat protein [Sphingomonas oligophenolica]|uniref:Tetratricopeptide repeat protein n=1 Tax=Sphingomonas oligophenolica TaxID=301154 RepID=A0ABU9Y5C9_9SPHN
MLALAIAAPARADRGTDDLAAYARARAADGDGKVIQAAAAYAAALSGAPDNVGIARRAYREALEAGDDALVDRAIATMERTGEAPPDAALLRYAGAVRAGNVPVQKAMLARIGAGPFDFIASLLRTWQAYDAGGDPFAQLDDAKGNPVARRYIAENRALLQIATGKAGEGVIDLEAMLGSDQASLDLRINAAQLLIARGKADFARSLLVGDDPAIAALRRSPGGMSVPTGAFGASRLLTRLASDLAEGDPTPLTLSLSRAALRLDPGNDRARMLLALALARGGAQERALATLDEIGEASPYRESALQLRVAVLNAAGDAQAALAAASQLATRKDATSADAARFADLLVASGRFADAAKAYRMAIARAGDGAPWTLYLQLGGALDQAGRWPEARAALEKAVELGPDAAVALNYLGYARLEHGEDVAASVAMLERANALQPDQASITDSLAWAYFKRGDAAKALPLLERAAQGEPGNATINEHLGDTLWSLGRRYEARYAWQAAAIVAKAEDGARLAGKIADGMRTAP